MSISWLTGKSVLLTGASGTVGSGLLRVILEARPRVLRLLDSHEHGLFRLQQTYGDQPELRYLLGDIRDSSRLRRAMRGIDVVIHSAALKHVAIGEYNPFEIVQTNLVGLQNVIQAALENEVERVIFTSSDKAVNPTNAMGASKLMGERLMSAANEITGGRRTRFASVRFGNILGSNGSVAGIFRDQIEQGGPVTLTDHRMTRFVMGLDHSVRLVLRAAELATGGEVFVLKMPVLRIADLAAVMVDRLAPRFGREPRSIPIHEIGAKPGEKLFEELLAESELPQSFEDDELIVYLGEQGATLHGEPRPYLEHMRPTSAPYSSDRIEPMSRGRIEPFLEEIGVLSTYRAAGLAS
jgi:FlaA1/EpsC-like NDP-sugar epimerase